MYKQESGLLKYLWVKWKDGGRFLPIILAVTPVTVYSFALGVLNISALIMSMIALIVAIVQISRLRRGVRQSVCVFGTVVDYHIRTSSHKTGPRYHRKYYLVKHYTPVLQYCTEDGELIRARYGKYSQHKKYMEGSSTTICYFPNDPKRFYFLGRENELFHVYWLTVAVCGIIALICVFDLIGNLM